MLTNLTNFWKINATIFFPIPNNSKQTNMFASCVSLYNAYDTWTSTCIASWWFVFYFKRWARTQFFSNVKQCILWHSKHFFPSIIIIFNEEKCEYQVVLFGFTQCQKSLATNRVVKIDVMHPFCVRHHIDVHLDTFVAFIRMDARKSWVILGLKMDFGR
jgi:hypothetical protein